MQDFRFTNNPTRRTVGAAAKLLERPRLWIPGGDYPGHKEWVGRAISEIGHRKIAMVAFWGGEGIGTVVYQRHPDDSARAEIKNISVEPEARGRFVARFMIRQVEEEIPKEFPGATSVIVDTKVTNEGMISFLLSQGYEIQDITKVEGSFAHNGVEDVVFTKPLAV